MGSRSDLVAVLEALAEEVSPAPPPDPGSRWAARGAVFIGHNATFTATSSNNVMIGYAAGHNYHDPGVEGRRELQEALHSVIEGMSARETLSGALDHLVDVAPLARRELERVARKPRVDLRSAYARRIADEVVVDIPHEMLRAQGRAWDLDRLRTGTRYSVLVEDWRGDWWELVAARLEYRAPVDPDDPVLGSLRLIWGDWAERRSVSQEEGERYE